MNISERKMAVFVIEGGFEAVIKIYHLERPTEQIKR